MTGNWHFKPIGKGETIREPTAEAFFASDAVRKPGSALIREGIQNSLDSTLPGEQTLIRISLINEADAPGWHETAQYFTSAWTHYTAEDNGLPPDELPQQGGVCPFLVFEDFGTKGLQGDPETPYPPKDKSENNFFHFFRAEGRTDKDTSKRGSWGLGKDTFFRASSINTLFGLTIRDDDRRRMVMGKTVLKSHYAGDEYCQDGYFGVRPDDEEHFIMPIEDDGAIEEFLNVFRSYRGGDPGLSIFVPWPDTEISAKEIIQSVFQNYFYTILAGELVVMVETQGIETWLDKDSLLNEARKIPEVQDNLPITELAEWALARLEDAERHELNMPDPRQGWSWSSKLFSEEVLQTLREKLQNQDNIAIRVPVTVRKRGVAAERSHFDVYLRSSESNERLRPVFIRDGIVISNVGAPTMGGMHSLVVIDHQPLSAFLRQSENPSHTIWQGQQVKKEYVSGVGDLDFVRRSVREIVNLLTAEDREEDRHLLADLFPAPGSGRRGGNGPGPIERNPSFFAITGTSSGFTVAPGRDQIAADSLVRVQAAYDIRRGNPLSKYRADDFQLDQTPIEYQATGVEVLEVNDNRMVLKIVEPGSFRLAVTGFDYNRQVYVRADVMEG